MASSKKHYKKQMRSVGVFTLGRETAEQDPLLETGFYENNKYETIQSKLDPSIILVGRTGSGKSATIKHLKSQHPDQVIVLNPIDMSLPYLTNLDVIRTLHARGVPLDPFFTVLWKHVFIVEILKHRYHIDSEQKQRTILSELKSRLGRDQWRKQSLEYLENFGEKFWCDTHDRVIQVADQFCEDFKNRGGLSVGIGAPPTNIGAALSNESSVQHLQTTNRELSPAFQPVVDTTLINQINSMITVLDQYVVDRQNFVYFMIDDLDREWVSESLRNSIIRCLLEAVLDMSRVENLKFVVAMRSNIISQLDYASQRRGPQQEKIDQMAFYLRWTRQDLITLLESRVNAAAERYQVNPKITLASLLPNVNQARGNPVDYILDHTLLRPRDVILFLNEAILVSEQRQQLSWNHLQQAITSYSRKRFEALRDEWKDPFESIERVLELFRGCPAVMSREEFVDKLTNIAIIQGYDSELRDQTWLTTRCEPMWNPQPVHGGAYSCYGPLTELLYSVGFIGVEPMSGRKTNYVYDQSDENVSIDVNVEAKYVIHPAFRSYLRTL